LITTTFNCLQHDSVTKHGYKEQLQKTVLVPPAVQKDTQTHTSKYDIIMYTRSFRLYILKNKKIQFYKALKVQVSFCLQLQ